jgi:hypothetical protein
MTLNVRKTGFEFVKHTFRLLYQQTNKDLKIMLAPHG